MVAESPDRKVNTDANVQGDDAKRLPSERDESSDSQHSGPRDVMKQAASDLEQGLVDTDMHGDRGVEKVKPAAPKSATPVAGKDAKEPSKT